MAMVTVPMMQLPMMQQMAPMQHVPRPFIFAHPQSLQQVQTCTGPAAHAMVFIVPARTQEPASETPSPETMTPATPKRSLQDLPVPGNVWKLSRNAEGCRMVQSALEDATSDATRLALAHELRGYVWRAIRCPHANHVLQKCFVTMRPSALQFMLDELVAKGAKAIVKAAQNEYACRVLQRMIEHCRPDQVAPIVEVLLAEGPALSRHIYGIFVMQHLLEHATESQKTCLVAKLVQQVCCYGFDQRTSRVLRTALSAACHEDQVKVAQAFILAKEMVGMARDRHAHTSAMLILDLVDGEDLAEAMRQLDQELPNLAASRYGRKVVAYLSKLRCGSLAARGGA